MSSPYLCVYVAIPPGLTSRAGATALCYGRPNKKHKPMTDMMTKSHSKEEEEKWWDWFNNEWDKKDEV